MNLVGDLEPNQNEVRKIFASLANAYTDQSTGLALEQQTEPLFSRNLQKLAFQVWRARRFRGRVLGTDDPFGEAMWDVLLYLYGETRLEHIKIKDARIGAGVQRTSGLRAIQVLIKRGLVEREGDRHDRRRKFVRLTANGNDRVRECLGAALGLLTAA